MGKLTLAMMVSVDGFIEGTDDYEADWIQIDEKEHRFINEMTASAELMLYGRKVYDVMIPYWPDAAESQDVPEYERDYGRVWVDKPKVVVSTTLKNPDYNTTVISEYVEDEVAKLKANANGDILCFGGGELASTLFAAELIDEVCLFINPVALGDGTPLFHDPVDLEFIETKAFDSGAMMLRAKPKY